MWLSWVMAPKPFDCLLLVLQLGPSWKGKWPKYSPFMAKTWTSHGPSHCFFLNHNQYAQGCSMPNFTILGVSHSHFSYKWPKCGPFMAKTWSLHGPSNQFFLNHNQCAQGYSMPNFTILGVSHGAFFLEMAKIWPFYGQNMVLTWFFKLDLPES